jgi:DNA-binding transcriptional LysR family regulator
MEVRQLEAFVVLASELHFGRAADRLHMAPPSLSELIRRLEIELGTPLFVRTTRRVTITPAGVEFLPRARSILEELKAARSAVRQVAGGESGTVRLGITPPAGPVLAPYLIQLFAVDVPRVAVDLHRMWLPNLIAALTSGEIDVGITCGIFPAPTGITTRVFCAERLLVGLRPGHRLAGSEAVELAQLNDEVLGMPPESLFPAWAISQRQALQGAGVTPKVVELRDTDLSAVRWLEQSDVDWILLISSLALEHRSTVVKPVAPLQFVPFSLLWNQRYAHNSAIAPFVQTSLTADPPPGWFTQPDHLRHGEVGQ